MALFNAKPKKEEKKGATPVATDAAAAIAIAPAAAEVLLSVRVTEKATDLALQNTYAFNVKLSANKRQVAEAVKALYKVTPVAVRMVSIPRKSRSHPRVREAGVSNLGKKAYVTLKKGDTISLN